MRRPFALPFALVFALAGAGELAGQFRNQTPGVFLPRASPKAAVAQTVGMTEIEVHYHRPSVNGREIWGALVPWGQVWRTGANENTLVSFSTPVTIAGQPLAAGSYGLHTVPAQGEWEVVFSHDTTAWGSFSYDPSRDALRVTIASEEAPHQEVMEFAFDDVTTDSAVLALRWEKLRLPIPIAVETHEIALAAIREQLKGLAQFSWLGWNQAAGYCLANEINLEEALQWADSSISVEERFENLQTKSGILAALGREQESAEVFELALAKANAGQLHNYGRQLQAQGKLDEALAIFERNAEQNPDAWFIGVGLARGHSALGNFERAVAHMKEALERAPEAQKSYIEGLVRQLEAGNKI